MIRDTYRLNIEVGLPELRSKEKNGADCSANFDKVLLSATSGSLYVIRVMVAELIL